MKGTIICISRQDGSGGREIGQRVAEQLGVVCYDKLLVQQTAREAGISAETVAAEDEQPLGFGELLSGNPFADNAALSEAFYSEKQQVFDAESQTMRHLAAKGPCVMIGRCAASVLRSAGYHVLSVFIYGDLDDRAKRIAARNGLSVKEAIHKAEKVDRMRKKFFDFNADTSWGEPASYDLMISSSRYGMEGTADLIVKAVADQA